MFRSLSFRFGAAVLLMSSFVVGGGIRAVHAGGYDASNDTISCNTFYGVAKFNPPLVFGGTATAVEIKVKGTLDACFTGAPVTVLPSKIKGTLTLNSNDCNALFAPTGGGTLTAKWKTVPALADSSSVISGAAAATSFNNTSYGGTNPEFDFTYGGVTGSFTGGDGGVNSTSHTITSEDINWLVVEACNPAGKGVKVLHLGAGQLTLQ